MSFQALCTLTRLCDTFLLKTHDSLLIQQNVMEEQGNTDMTALRIHFYDAMISALLYYRSVDLTHINHNDF